jgi:hypothetical protein
MIPSARCIRVGVALLFFASVLALGCSAPGAEEVPGELGVSEDKLERSLEEALANGDSRDVLVLLDDHAALGGADATSDAGTQDGEQALLRPLDLGGSGAGAIRDDGDDSSYVALQTREAVYRALAANVLASFSADEIELKHQYQSFPMLLVHVRSLAALEALADHEDVAHLFADRENEAFLTQSLGLIRQPTVLAGGNAGAGTAVAVLDTGADFTRAAFGSCSAAGASGCRVAYAADFAPSDGQHDDHGHGTNVSAIVLGVAPQTKVLALDVFTGGSAWSSHILAAVDWSIQNRATYNIVAMNLSLGSGLYDAPCSNNVFATGLASARSAGILPVVASGNSASSASISSPACVPAAVSVGAVYDSSMGGLQYSGCSDTSTTADKVTCFSNSASFLSVLAPGAMITAGGITMSGTSQAAPHVAGATAVLRAARPSESLDALVTRLTTTGPSVLDSRNDVSKRRLDLVAALGGAATPAPPPEATPPVASLEINDGATVTRSRSVVLALAASDASGVPSMCVANSSKCSSWQSFAASSSWMLGTGDGKKTVYVWVKDGAGNIRALNKTIVVDTKAPADKSPTVTPGDQRVALSWSPSTDSGSGVASYTVVFASNTAPASCTAGTVVYSGTASSAVHSALTNGATYGYRVCSSDRAGNLSAGKTAVAKPAPEFQAPTGSVSINAGAAFSSSLTVTLSLSASDASTVTSVCLSNANSCSNWSEYGTSKSWTLARSEGTRIVNVWFRDQWGNANATPVSDSIVLDTKAPTLGSLTATVQSRDVFLTWSGKDAGAGVESYSLVWATGRTAPASCSAGRLAYSGPLTSYRHAGLSSGKYQYRLCARDRLGNLTKGTTRAVTVP